MDFPYFAARTAPGENVEDATRKMGSEKGRHTKTRKFHQRASGGAQGEHLSLPKFQNFITLDFWDRSRVTIFREGGQTLAAARAEYFWECSCNIWTKLFFLNYFQCFPSCDYRTELFLDLIMSLCTSWEQWITESLGLVYRIVLGILGKRGKFGKCWHRPFAERKFPPPPKKVTRFETKFPKFSSKFAPKFARNFEEGRLHQIFPNERFEISSQISPQNS